MRAALQTLGPQFTSVYFGQKVSHKGFAEFASEEPLTCPGLTQVFTKPLEITGVIYEFIELFTLG